MGHLRLVPSPKAYYGDKFPIETNLNILYSVALERSQLLLGIDAQLQAAIDYIVGTAQ